MKQKKILLGAAALVATTGTFIRVSAEESAPVLNSSDTDVLTTTSESTAISRAQVEVEQTGAAAAETQAAQDATQAELATAQTALSTAEQAQTTNNAEITEATQTINEVTPAIGSTEKEVTSAQEVVATAEQTLEQEVAANPNAETAIEIAEQNVQMATSEADAANKTVETTAASVEDATVAVEQAQAAVDNAAANIATAEKTLQDAESIVAEKTTAVEAANTNLTTKQAEVTAKTEELTKAVADAGASTITNTSVVKADNIKPNYETNTARNKAETATTPTAFQKMYLTKESTLFNGQAVENIVLTPEQQAAYETNGYFNYTPNAKAIATYFLEYVNEIRRINGISEMLTYSPDVEALAQARAEEALANNKVSHATSIPSNGLKDWENITATGGFTKSTTSNDIFSDKAMAYHLAFRYFSEYTNPSTGKAAYGHRNNLLFTRGDMGTGIAYKTGSHDSYDLYSVSIGNRPEDEWLFIDGFETDVTYETVQNANGTTTTVQYYKGQRLKFLPQTAFVYYTTVTTTTPNAALTAAKKALADYTTSSTAALNTLKNNVAAAQSELNTAKSTLITAKENLARVAANGTGETALATAKENLIKTETALATAKVNQTKAASTLAVAKAKLEQVQKANQSLVTARNTLADAQNTLAALQTKLVTLKQAKTSAETKLARANAQLETLAMNVANAKAAVTSAQAAHDNAVKANTVAQRAYVEAQEALARLLSLSQDKTISILEDGTIIALPATAPKAPVLPSIDFEKYLSDKRTEINMSGKKATPIFNDEGRVIDYKEVPVPLATLVSAQGTAQESVQETATATSIVSLPNTGSASNELAYFGLALGGLALIVKRRRKFD
ncbi:TPA: LPXTG cell wall anchor domain-containing protein [Streptococcus suis]